MLQKQSETNQLHLCYFLFWAVLLHSVQLPEQPMHFPLRFAEIMELIAINRQKATMNIISTSSLVTINAAHHAITHWVTATSAACQPEPSSLLNAAIAATQGV